jgi:heat shock protein HtpX
MTTYDFIASNKRKTWLLIAACTAVVMGVAYVADRAYGYGGGLVFTAGIYSFFSALTGYFAGDKIALATSGARRVTAAENPYLTRMVENLCISQGLPLPKIHVIQDPAINAFATGRDPQHASIAVTTGAIEKLENEELEGVLAHELSHVQNYDIRVMTIVIVLVGIVSVMAQMLFRFGGHRRDDRENKGGALVLAGLVLMILAPLVAQLIQLAVSRRREYLADASGALMTRFPDGLARALAKIQAESRPMSSASAATAHLYIASPFAGKALSAMFSTHPPVEERIRRLRAMGSTGAEAA